MNFVLRKVSETMVVKCVACNKNMEEIIDSEDSKHLGFFCNECSAFVKVEKV